MWLIKPIPIFNNLFNIKVEIEKLVEKFTFKYFYQKYFFSSSKTLSSRYLWWISIYLSIYLSIHLTFYLSVYLSIYLWLTRYLVIGAPPSLLGNIHVRSIWSTSQSQSSTFCGGSGSPKFRNKMLNFCSTVLINLILANFNTLLFLIYL